ncbi:hypothetical protein [Pannonibacter indicus]|uniref:Uncharacterized protein n=1 Tax=Pannonibacter indicus TaxID=466044 RepID=A0A0K6HLJ6_9HYPH|nr:hypothetical protein [Pannonibacter indicus]CUA91686.1 hypothetical protein Ga0061067_10130 [Pannonibacter indicus]
MPILSRLRLNLRRARFLPENPLLRLLAVNALSGSVVALVVVGGLFASNAGGLYDLVANASDPAVPVILLAFGFIITLGSAAMGTAVMMLPRDGGNDSGRGRRERACRGLPGEPVLIPVPVHSTPQRTVRRG